MDGAARASVSRGPEARFYLQPADGHGRVHGDRSEGSDCGGGGGVAVYAPYSVGAGESSRADSDGGELVGAMAGAGGDAEFEWQPVEGGREVLDDLEQGLRRCVLREWTEAVDQGRQDRSRHEPCSQA